MVAIPDLPCAPDPASRTMPCPRSNVSTRRDQTAPTDKAKRCTGPNRKPSICLLTATCLLFTLPGWGLAAGPKAKRSSLLVQVMEADVDVTVDQKPMTIDADKLGRVELPVGRHTLTVRRGVDVLFSRTFTIRADEHEDIIARWKPRVASGTNAEALKSYEVAEGYRRQGKLDSANAEYSRVIKLDPKFVWSYVNRGLCFVQQNKPDEAITELDRAIAIDPTLAEAFDYRGWASNLRQDFDQAISDYSQALKLSPNRTQAYHGRGDAYKGKGDIDRAIDDYSKALGLPLQTPGRPSTGGDVIFRKNSTTKPLKTRRRPSRLTPNRHRLFFSGPMLIPRRETSIRPSPTALRRHFSTPMSGGNHGATWQRSCPLPRGSWVYGARNRCAQDQIYAQSHGWKASVPSQSRA